MHETVESSRRVLLMVVTMGKYRKLYLICYAYMQTYSIVLFVYSSDVQQLRTR
jgi:hypothetical protein